MSRHEQQYEIIITGPKTTYISFYGLFDKDEKKVVPNMFAVTITSESKQGKSINGIDNETKKSYNMFDPPITLELPDDNIRDRQDEVSRILGDNFAFSLNSKYKYRGNSDKTYVQCYHGGYKTAVKILLNELDF